VAILYWVEKLPRDPIAGPGASSRAYAVSASRWYCHRSLSTSGHACARRKWSRTS